MPSEPPPAPTETIPIADEPPKDFKSVQSEGQTHLSDAEKIEQRNIIVLSLIKRYNFVTLEGIDILYVEKDGVYVANGVPESLIGAKCEERLGSECTRTDVLEVIARIKRKTIKPIDFFTRVPLNLVKVQNGVLDLDAKQLVLKADPFLSKIPVAYNPKASCPTIDKFLHDVLNNDNEVQAMYEFFGYLLHRDYPIAKAFLFVGEGSNGKTTLLSLMAKFVGSDNATNMSLQELAHSRFSLAELYGKLGNFHPDISDKRLLYTGTIKQLTGNDWVDAEKKFIQRHIRFKNYAKLGFSCNKIPEVKNDDSQAWWRRWQIFQFDKIFDYAHKNVDPNILEKLTTEAELSGLLNKAIEGLKRLLANKEFSGADSFEVTREKWRNSDTVSAFIDERVEDEKKRIGQFEVKQRVYEEYINFCEDRSLVPLSQIDFGRKFAAQTGALDKQRVIDGKEGVHVYYNVKLKPLMNRDFFSGLGSSDGRPPEKEFGDDVSSS